jgi:uncharacterized membrane protein
MNLPANTDTPANLVAPIRFFGPPQPFATLVGLLFAWRSFFPTLMPRTALTQGAMTAISIGIGYGLGLLIAFIIVQFTAQRKLPPVVKRVLWWIEAITAIVILIMALMFWSRWQNQQRALVGLEPLGQTSALVMIVVAAMLTILVMLFGRLIGKGVLRLHRFNRRHLPAALVSPATIILVLVIGWFIVKDVVIREFTNWANNAYGLVDTSTSPGTLQPINPEVSGSPASLVDWDSLGIQGRDFAGRATPVALINEFNAERGVSTPALEPIRVYAGLRSADDAAARADLVIEELERTGAFDRSVLVVTTVTGTGWVDPYAARSIELMHGGDTAIAAIQYSYLPSWISSLLDGDKMTEAGATLYNAIFEYWSALDETQRPELVAFGQSLGSLGGEAPFVGIDMQTSMLNLSTRADAVLFTGPTNSNPMWRQFIDGRDLGSPAWEPMIDNGELVRFSTGQELDQMPDDWDGTRVLYVQHPSDPVTFWGSSWLYQTPLWMNQPRGFDVPQQGGWFPIVTWVQGVFDLMAGFSAPPGHGHDYSPNFPGAWSQLVPPSGWNEGDIALLSQFMAQHPPAPPS